MSRIIFTAGMIFMAAATHAGIAAAAENDAKGASLLATISTLDAEFFAAFNHCSSPGQLEKHASY